MSIMTNNSIRQKMMIAMLASSFIAGLLYFLTSNFGLAILPIFAVPGFFLLRNYKMIKIDDNKILSILIFFLFIFDDIATGAWANKTPLTELIGRIIYRSYGLTGVELIFLAFAVYLVLKNSISTNIKNLKNGWLFTICATLPIFILCLVSASKVLAAAVKSMWHFQIRFTYLMVVYASIGFLCIKDYDKFSLSLKPSALQ